MLHNPNWKQPTEVELDEADQHLLQAADYINQYGWCQGTFKNEQGQVCIVGALGAVTQQYKSIHIYSQMRLKITKLIGCGATIWNDVPGRTKDEVVAMLRKAAYSK